MKTLMYCACLGHPKNDEAIRGKTEGLLALLLLALEDLLQGGVLGLAVLAVDEVAAHNRLVLGGLLAVLVLLLHDGDVALAPVDDQGLADQEQHDGDLGNGEEAPDTGLLHEVLGDEGRHHRTSDEEEETLDDHSLLLIEDEERSEHQEGVDAGTHDVVGRIRHRDRPAQVSHLLVLVRAQDLTAQPLRGWLASQVHGVQGGDERQEVADEQQESTDQTQALDDSVAI